MSEVLFSISLLLLIAGVVETIFYLIFLDAYYKLGPTVRREEWQTSVSAQKARSALEEAIGEGTISGRFHRDTLCFRQRKWDWGLMPRCVLRINETPRGAFFVCELKPFGGFASVLLALIAFQYGDHHEILASVMLVGTAMLLSAVWIRGSRMLARLSPLRKQLASIGLRICEFCGYDLHGLEGSRPCPECGRIANTHLARLGTEEIKNLFGDRERLRRWGAIASIAFGIPLTMVGPVIMGSIFWFFAGSLLHFWIRWDVFCLFTALITVPLLFRLEWQTKERYLDASTVEISNPFPENVPWGYSPAGQLTGGVFRPMVSVLANPGAVATLFVELLLQGPRAILRGWWQLRRTRALRSINMDRAAEVLSALMRRADGCSRKELLLQGEQMADLVVVLGLLSFYGWIGVAAKGDRVFLYSESRSALTGVSDQEG